MESNDSALVELVESLDAQSLSYRDFDAVLLVPEGAVSLRRRLEQLAGRRPNVVIQAFEGPWPDALRSTSAEVAAPSVLPLSRHLNGGATRLHPEALRRLADFLETNECDVRFRSGQLVFGADAYSVRPATRCRPDRRGDRAEAHKRCHAGIPLGVHPNARVAWRCFGSGRRSMHPPRSGSWARTPSWPASPALTIRRCQADEMQWLPGSRTSLLPGGTVGSCSPPTRQILMAIQPACCRFAARTVAWSIGCRLLRTRPQHGTSTYGRPLCGASLPDGQWSLMSNAYAADGEPVARSPVPATPTGDRRRRRQAGRSCQRRGRVRHRRWCHTLSTRALTRRRSGADHRGCPRGVVHGSDADDAHHGPGCHRRRRHA